MMKTREDKKLLDTFFSGEKAKKALIIILAAGIVLIIVSEIFPVKKSQPELQIKTDDVMTTDEYVGLLEEKLENMVSRISGGEALVTLTAEAGYKNVFANEEKESVQENEGKLSQSRENSTVVIKASDGSQNTVPVLRYEPEIRGVVVLCENGGDIRIQQQIISAVTTVLHISSAKVCVLELNGGGK